MDVIVHINIILIKKPHQNPLRIFKYLSIHKDRQRKATLLQQAATKSLVFFNNFSSRVQDFLKKEIELFFQEDRNYFQRSISNAIF